MSSLRHVLVTGGAGYIGAVLVPRLLQHGYRVRVLERYLFGDQSLAAFADDPNLEQVKGDIRDETLLRQTLTGCGAVIHLASVSGDPGYDAQGVLCRSVNFEAFETLVKLAKNSGVQRFIYTSS